MEEEYCYNITTERYEGPGCVHVKTRKMSGLYYSWVYIIARNEYGETKEMLEFPPFFTDIVDEVASNNTDFEINGRMLSIRCSSPLNISIYTIDGRNIYSYFIDHDTDLPLDPGIYILTITDQTATQSKKIIIR